MHAKNYGDRTLTELDHVRLTKLVAVKPHSDLEELLDLVEVMPSREIAPDFVTMNSQVTIVDTRTGQRQKLTPCYPTDADPATGLVSVLSPVGMSLLGLRIGATAQWRTPGGEEFNAEVAEVHYQPEASGDYTT
ncbi:GreA/GreB family elongation factor [Variovorax sp. J22P240]|uniref:GreA/GreB family elongation factor n=1 Tax=unclassified Variovorax TaxID=663243 RepID=UPI0025760496|nr:MULTISPECIES: GreA/GreB family elongation factor [unclassified Variovorax]MDM0001343.1 GreA/GreB family elongation factor [Variovorax sp. J22P240]MDM0048699.1 GreA/GreB family elongation factor [Variovorax sp. J22R115]